MWKIRQEIIEENAITKYRIENKNGALTCYESIQLLDTSEPFRLFFNKVLAENNFNGYFFECIPFDESWEKTILEFVLIYSPVFSKLKAEQNAFSAYFTKNEKVVSFPNLGKNAWLIAPAPEGDFEIYSHFAKFVKNAPIEQIDAFWQLVGKECKKRISSPPIWLSTHGLGVYWLHMRVDTIPKYYHFSPYKYYFKK